MSDIAFFLQYSAKFQRFISFIGIVGKIGGVIAVLICFVIKHDF